MICEYFFFATESKICFLSGIKKKPAGRKFITCVYEVNKCEQSGNAQLKEINFAFYKDIDYSRLHIDYNWFKADSLNLLIVYKVLVHTFDNCPK